MKGGMGTPPISSPYGFRTLFCIHYNDSLDTRLLGVGTVHCPQLVLKHDFVCNLQRAMHIRQISDGLKTLAVSTTRIGIDNLICNVVQIQPVI